MCIDTILFVAFYLLLKIQIGKGFLNLGHSIYNDDLFLLSPYSLENIMRVQITFIKQDVEVNAHWKYADFR